MKTLSLTIECSGKSNVARLLRRQQQHHIGLPLTLSVRRQFMRSFVIIAALLLGVAACSHEKQLPVREAYWAADLENSKGDLEDRAQLAIWLETRNVSYDVAGAGSLRKDFRIPLERVAGDGIVCAYWVIELIGTTADDGAIQDLEISKQGTCL